MHLCSVIVVKAYWSRSSRVPFYLAPVLSPFLVFALFRRLICRDATKHTYLIWFLQGKTPRLVPLIETSQIREVFLYRLMSRSKPIIHSQHCLPNDCHKECKDVCANAVDDPSNLSANTEICKLFFLYCKNWIFMVIHEPKTNRYCMHLRFKCLSAYRFVFIAAI